MNTELEYLYSKTKVRYVIHQRIGSGGEGEVYEVATSGSEKYVARVYREKITREKAEKLDLMVQAFDEKLQEIAAWPKELVFNARGEVVGFLMDKIGAYKPIHELFNPSARRKHFPNADWSFLVNTARNVVAAFKTIHSHGFVIGDVNEGNLMVSGSSLVKFIDCDSFQISKDQRMYSCEVGVPMYTPPEMQGLSTFRERPRTTNHDIFGMAVICFQLLFMGRHPFVGVYSGPDTPLEKAIEKHLFAYSRNGSLKGIQPPPDTLPSNSVQIELMGLFETAFDEQGEIKRPPLSTWFEEFTYLKNHLKTCSREPIHKYFQGLDSCPWCQMENGKGVIFFTSSRVTGFSLKDFNVDEQWRKILNVAPLDEVTLDYSKYPIQNRSVPIEYLFFRMLRVIQKIAAFAIPTIFFFTEIKLFIFAVPVAFIVYHLRLFDGEIERERQKRANALNNVKLRWKVLEEKWSREATNSLFEKKLQELREVKSKFERLGSEYNRERQQLHARREELQLRQFLSNYFISQHSIPNIGDLRKLTLSSFGIDTAADIEKLRKLKVPGFGGFLEGHLFAWRNTISKRFKFDPTRGIDPEEVNRLDRRFENLRVEYQNKLTSGAEVLTNIKRQIANNRISMKTDIETAGTAYRQAEYDLKWVK